MIAAQIEQSHDAVRRTALVLHALAPEDRDWILGHLPERNRAQVMPCLAELVALGIPRDQALVASAVREPGQPDARCGDVESAERLIAVLESEPASVVATVLRARSVSERDAVLEALPLARASQVRRLLATSRIVPVALAAALDEEIARVHALRARVPRFRNSLVRRCQAGWLRISGALH